MNEIKLPLLQTKVFFLLEFLNMHKYISLSASNEEYRIVKIRPKKKKGNKILPS